MEEFYIGAYWGQRREPVEDCAQRLADCLERLAQIDDLLSTWFLRARSKKAAREPVDQDVASLAALLSKGRNRTDFDPEVIDELGFSAGMWNRQPEAVGLSCTVGVYSQWVGNVFLLNLPEPEGAATRLYRPEAAMEIMRAVIEAWEPGWATYSSSSLREAQEVGQGEPVVGWMTYLRSTEPTVEPHDNVRWHSMGSGQLITIGQEFTDASDTAVVALRNELRRAGSFTSL